MRSGWATCPSLVLALGLAGCGAGPAASLASPAPDPRAAAVNDGTQVLAPGIAMHTVRPLPTSVVGEYGPHGGCVPGYGRGRACLPPISPAAVSMRMTAAEMPWTCRDVRELLPRGIVLDRPGRDPLRLDRDRDGRACGPSD